MADEPTNQTISDDQELAKVLAGVNAQAETETPAEEAPADATAPAADDAAAVTPPTDEPAATVVPAPTTDDTAPVVQPLSGSGDSDLDSIKVEALNELRPLVDKLNVAPEEKFDTYLLLLRSTDDKELIEPAHEAAKAITDEARRAQALLDIIKEIDFLSQNQK